MAGRRSTWEGAQRCTTSWGCRIRWSKSRPASSILLCVRPRDEKKQFFILALDDLRYNMTDKKTKHWSSMQSNNNGNLWCIHEQHQTLNMEEKLMNCSDGRL